MKELKNLEDNIYLNLLGQTPVKNWLILNEGKVNLKLDIVSKLSKKFMSYVKKVEDIEGIYCIATKSAKNWIAFNLGINYNIDGDKKYKIIFYKISKKED